MGLRLTRRLSLTILHILLGLALMASLYPRLAPTRQQRLKQWWSKRLVQALGVRLASHGDVQTAGLLVGNHISWLDIFVINALAPSAFVSKDDVRDWPVFGWLSARADTIFLERGSRRAAHRASEHIQDCLRQGQRIALFPEGTTSDGHTVLPFHSALLQAAIDSAQPVQALALRYLDAQG